MKLKIFAAFTAACVMAVGLYGQAVESEAVNLLGQDYFLSYTNNSTIADMSAYLIEKEGVLEVEETMAVGLWSAGEADMSKVVNNGDVNWLNLDTAGDVVTNALYAKEDMNYSIAEKGKAVISATMLMVPSDEIEASFVDGYSTDGNFGFIDNGDLKFGLYAYEYDVTKTVTEGDTTKEVVEVVTNLVIYHSYYDTPIPTDDDQLITPVAYTNYVYEVPSNTDFTQPQTVKITLMQAKTEDLFFKVTLNGIDVVTPYGCAEATIVNCPDELPYRDGGPWLRCVNNGNVNSISAINFSGTGTINGLTAGTIDANGEGGGEGGDDTEITLSWNEFAGFADTTVGETATADVTFNLANANEANVTIEGDSAFAIADQTTTLGTVTVTFAPTEAKVYNATLTVTAGDKSATLSITGTGVAAGEPALTYPDDSAITDAALVAWLTGKNATQAQIDALGTVEALNEKYLLNLDLENSSYSLKIKSLAVGDDVKVEVELTRLNGETAVEVAINGKLQLWGTTDLGVAFEDCGLTEINNADFSAGTTAVKSFIPETGVKFFKAVIVNPPAAE